MESFPDWVRARPDLARKIATESVQQGQEVLRRHMQTEHNGMLMLGVCVACHTLTAAIQRHNLSQQEVESILREAASSSH